MTNQATIAQKRMLAIKSHAHPTPMGMRGGSLYRGKSVGKLT